MKKIVIMLALAGAAAIGSAQYYPSVATKGTVNDGEIAVFDGVSGRYIRSSGETNQGAYITNLLGTLGTLTTNLGNSTNAQNSLGLLVTNNAIAQSGTNSVFEARISSNDALHAAQVNTNAGFEARLDAIDGTNGNFDLRIGSNEAFRAAQVNTNTGFEARLDAIDTTNGNFDLRIGSNEAFRAAQVTTNSAFELRLDNLESGDTGLETRIASNEAFRAAQVSTNSGFQTLFDNQQTTNQGFEARYIAQTNVNRLLTVRIGSNETFRIAQVNTNIGFQTLFDNQVNTNQGFENRLDAIDLTNANFNARISSNETFTGGFETNFDYIHDRIYAQISSNAGYEVRIESNQDFRVAQVNTNAGFETRLDGIDATNGNFDARIGSNEEFRAAQVNTNAGFEVRIGSNEDFRVAQVNTNAGFEVRIGSNEDFRVAQVNTNAGFETRLDGIDATNGNFDARIGSNEEFRVAQVNTNAGFEVRIGSNEDFRVAQVNSNESYEAFRVRIGSNETFRIAQVTTNSAFEARITIIENTNAVQDETNANFDQRIIALEGSGGVASNWWQYAAKDTVILYTQSWTRAWQPSDGIAVTGDPSPDVTGVYTQITDAFGTSQWELVKDGTSTVVKFHAGDLWMVDFNATTYFWYGATNIEDFEGLYTNYQGQATNNCYVDKTGETFTDTWVWAFGVAPESSNQVTIALNGTNLWTLNTAGALTWGGETRTNWPKTNDFRCVGVTDSTVYRGDWGAAASNLALAASNAAAAAQATADDALPKAGGELSGPMGLGGNALTNADFIQITNNAGLGRILSSDAAGNGSWAARDLDAQGRWLTNAAGIQMTNGTPVSGAVWTATDTAGNGNWSPLSAIEVNNDTTWTIADAGTRNLGFTNTVSLITGSYDGTNWVPGVIGWCNINVSVNIITIAADDGARLNMRLYQNGTLFRDKHLAVGTGIRYTPSASFQFYNSATNNWYYVDLRNVVGRTITNAPDAIANYFSGIILRP